MKDFIERLTNYKTTFVGLAAAIAAVLALTGVLEPENQAGAVENVTTVYEGIVAVMAALSGIILMFSKDSDK